MNKHHLRACQIECDPESRNLWRRIVYNAFNEHACECSSLLSEQSDETHTQCAIKLSHLPGGNYPSGEVQNITISSQRGCSAVRRP